MRTFEVLVHGFEDVDAMGTPKKKRAKMMNINCNYSGMLIGLPIAIMYFLARKNNRGGRGGTLEVFNQLFPLRAPSAHSAVKFSVWLQYAPCPG